MAGSTMNMICFVAEVEKALAISKVAVNVLIEVIGTIIT